MSIVVCPSVVTAVYTIHKDGSKEIVAERHGSLRMETITLLEIVTENEKRRFFLKFCPRGDLWDELFSFVEGKYWEKYSPGLWEIDEKEFYANIKCT